MGRYHNMKHRWRRVRMRQGCFVFTSPVGYVRQQSESLWTLERRGPWVPVVTGSFSYTPASMLHGYRRAAQAMRALERYLAARSARR